MTSTTHSDWLDGLRRAAKTRADDAGLPTRRDEAWKYTDIGALGVAAFALAEEQQGARPDVPSVGGGIRLMLVNGRLVAPSAAELPAGVVIAPLDATVSSEQVRAHLGQVIPADRKSLAALNGALFGDGLLLHIGTGVTLDHAIDLVSFGQAGDAPVAFHPRCLVVVEDGGSATLIERHLGQGTYFSNSVVEIALGSHASRRHYKLQDEAANAIHVSTTGVSLAAGARYAGVLVQTGARLARHEVHAALVGAGATFELDGAYLGRDHQHLDNTTFVTHAAPGGTSRQLFKGVLDGQARGVFQGSVLVERAAQKTDAYQLSKALLLSGQAEMDGKPELEIYADDVKCGHGCTVGDIDEEALFYLRARGIAESDARQLLLEAFLADVLERIVAEPVREAFAAVVGERLQGETRRIDVHHQN
jgi:Fe-S cluster assembly protein SufD